MSDWFTAKFHVLVETRGPLVLYRSPECIGYADLEQAWKYMTVIRLLVFNGTERHGTYGINLTENYKFSRAVKKYILN